MNIYEIFLSVAILLNLLFTILIGLNIIQIREIVQSGSIPLEKEERSDDKGLKDVETSQKPYSSVDVFTKIEEQ